MNGGSIFFLLRLLLAAALYGFLGWAFVVLWNDLRHQTLLLQKRRPPPLFLFRETPPEEEYQFTAHEITLGRGQGNTLIIDHETVSNQHTRLAFHSRQWWVEDQQSTNGTFLNGQRVTSPMVITTGDVLECGAITLLVSISDPL